MIEVAGRYVVPLPKLNPSQLGILADRLAGLGYDVSTTGEMTARQEEKVIHVNARGYCWSHQDPTDGIAPAIPALLAAQKQTLTADAIACLYFMSTGRSEVVVRFSPRIERGPLWTKLRESGACGLTPDEHLVATSVLSAGTGRCRMLTDFPVEGNHVRIFGRRVYYDSRIDVREAASTLRMIGRKRERNSYLPRDGVVRFRSAMPLRQSAAEIGKHLGEWCFFQPSYRKGLIAEDAGVKSAPVV